MNQARCLKLAVLSGVVLPAIIMHGAEPGLLLSEFVYTNASFPQCHASTVAETGTGLAVAWFGGTREGHQDVGIWFAKRNSNGWQPSREVANGVQSESLRYPCWNPVLFMAPEKRLMLFYKVGPSPSEWWGMLRVSADEGKTWSEGRRLPTGIVGPVKNKPVLLSNGTLLCSSSSEDKGWRVHFELTRDSGETWEVARPAAAGMDISAIQPSVLRHADGRLQAIGRTRQRHLFESWSADQGKTWSALRLIELPNPNAGTDAITLANGKHLLVYNHTPRGRSPLNVAVSTDGQSWERVLELENDPGKEFSYPAVIQTKDGMVHVTYTWHRERIKHAVIDPAALKPVVGREIR